MPRDFNGVFIALSGQVCGPETASVAASVASGGPTAIVSALGLTGACGESERKCTFVLRELAASGFVKHLGGRLYGRIQIPSGHFEAHKAALNLGTDIPEYGLANRRIRVPIRTFRATMAAKNSRAKKRTRSKKNKS